MAGAAYCSHADGRSEPWPWVLSFILGRGFATARRRRAAVTISGYPASICGGTTLLPSTARPEGATTDCGMNAVVAEGCICTKLVGANCVAQSNSVHYERAATESLARCAAYSTA